jgi:DNA-directed RNA polymerase II subunit RPB2
MRGALITPFPQAESQHQSADAEPPPRYTIKFNQIYLGQPQCMEADGTATFIRPNDARLRNMTYASYIFTNVEKTVSYGDREETETFEKVCCGW